MSSTDARLVFATPDGTGIEVFLPDDARAVIETALRRERTRTHERLVVRSRDLLLPSGRRTRRTDELIGEICDEIEAVVASTPTTIDPTTADRLATALEGLATVRAAYQEPDAELFRSFAAQVELATHGLFRPTRTAAWLLCWPAELVEVLDAELARLTRAMESDDATVARLFPAPHLDPELAEGWDALMRRSLVERRLEAIVEVRAAVEDGHTDEDGGQDPREAPRRGHRSNGGRPGQGAVPRDRSASTAVTAATTPPHGVSDAGIATTTSRRCRCRVRRLDRTTMTIHGRQA